MITVFANNVFKHREKIYRCSIGKNGIKRKKIEGDECSPEGTFCIGDLYFRSDRVKNFKTKKKLIPIGEEMYWSDNPESIHYNKLTDFIDGSSEKLFRNDSIYDLLLVVKYNVNPIVKNKGSAIFIHIAKRNYSPTKGCIALSKKDFIHFLKDLGLREKISIVNKDYISA